MIYEPIPFKRCYACKTFYPGTREYFSSNKSKRDKLRSECKFCHRESARKYRKSYPEKHNASSRRYVLRHPERKRERDRRYIKNNPEYFKKKSKDAYKNRKQQMLESCKRWQQKNPEKVREIRHRRRARVLQADGTFTAEDIQHQYKAQKGKCYWCKKKVGKDYHVDHVIPIAKGGSNWPSNIVIACPYCNQSKNDKLWSLL